MKKRLLIALSILGTYSSVQATTPLDLMTSGINRINHEVTYSFNPAIDFMAQDYIGPTKIVPTNMNDVNMDQFLFSYTVTTNNADPLLRKTIVSSTMCEIPQQTSHKEHSCSINMTPTGNYLLHIKLMRKSRWDNSDTYTIMPATTKNNSQIVKMYNLRVQ